MTITRKTILTCTVGSTLHGTSVDDGLEDLDLMSIVLESPHDVMGWNRWEGVSERTKPEGVRSEAGDVDHTIYGLRKWLEKACSGNPTMILPLFVPKQHLQVCTLEGHTLRSFAPNIISRKAGDAFRGYMHAQLQRLNNLDRHTVTRPELVAAHGYDTKYAGHIVRLAYQGMELMRTGRITLPMPPLERRFVVDVRQGMYQLDDLMRLFYELEVELKQAMQESKLKEKPDWDLLEDWMTTVYEQHWRYGHAES